MLCVLSKSTKRLCVWTCWAVCSRMCWEEKTLIRSTLQSLCGAPESCIYFHCHQTFAGFVWAVPRATSCSLCPGFLSEKSRVICGAHCSHNRTCTQLHSHINTLMLGWVQLFPPLLLDLISNTHILGFQEVHCKPLKETTTKATTISPIRSHHGFLSFFLEFWLFSPQAFT